MLIEAMRHVGLPSVEFLQAARECNGETVAKLHALALHQYRATHKTKSQLISLIHLLSVYGTHPELRDWLHATQSAVLVKTAQYLDRMLEKRNDVQKSRNTSRLHLLNSLHFTAPAHITGTRCVYHVRTPAYTENNSVYAKS